MVPLGNVLSMVLTYANANGYNTSQAMEVPTMTKDNG